MKKTKQNNVQLNQTWILNGVNGKMTRVQNGTVRGTEINHFHIFVAKLSKKDTSCRDRERGGVVKTHR